MCLAIPAKVITINNGKAEVDFEGNVAIADITLLPDVKVGDYILVHAGLAIQKFDEQEALENLALIRSMYSEE